MNGSQGLAQVLAEVGWRPEQFAHQLNASAERHGSPERVHPKTPYKWLQGKIPRSPWPTLAATLLSNQLGRVINPADLGWPDIAVAAMPASTALIVPWSAAGGLQAAATVADAENMRRRVFLNVVGASLTAPAHEWLIAQPADDVRRTAGRRLDAEVIDHLEAITGGLRRLDDHLGGGQTLQLVQHQVTTVVGLLAERSYTEDVGRRLHGTAAELLRLAGFLAFDDGQHAQAQRYWIAALHEAHSAGDRALGANILGFMSCQAKDLGQVREAVTLAETALAGHRANSPAVRAILSLRAAEAYANEHSPTRAARAIEDAFTDLSAAPPSHGDPEWSYWMSEAQAHAQAGYCHLKLQQWREARSHLGAALRLQGGDYTREGALRRTLLATAYASQPQPDIDRATELANQAVDTLSEQVTSARCVGHLNQLTATLKPYRRNAAVRELSSRVVELTRQAT